MLCAAISSSLCDVPNLRNPFTLTIQVATCYRPFKCVLSVDMRVTYITYTPALDKNVGVNRDNLISSYFLQGFTTAEIAGFLALHHGIIL